MISEHRESPWLAEPRRAKNLSHQDLLSECFESWPTRPCRANALAIDSVKLSSLSFCPQSRPKQDRTRYSPRDCRGSYYREQLRNFVLLSRAASKFLKNHS